METIISNKIYISEPIQQVVDWIKQNLVITNPKYMQLMKLGKEQDIHRYHIKETINLYATYESKKMYIVPRGCLYGLWHYIKMYPYTVSYNEPVKIAPEHFNTTNGVNLYDYQKRALESLIKAKGGILKASAGSGKTEIATELIKTIGQRTLIIVHTHDLLKQFADRIHKYYPYVKIGFITEGNVDFGEDITIATWQTMKKCDKALYENYFNLVVIDEAHHICQNPTNLRELGRIVENIKARYTYGLTATPYRADTLTPSMYAIVGLDTNGEFKPTYTIDRKDCNIMNATYFQIETKTFGSFEYLDEEGKFNYAALIDYLSHNNERNDLIVENVIKYSLLNKKTTMYEYLYNEHDIETVAKSDPYKFMRKQIILCNLVDQAKIIYNKLLEKYENGESLVRPKLLVGEISTKKRQEILGDKSGDTWDCIVGTYALAQEGLDLPILSILHIATPQKNKKTIEQSVGRVERVCDNKQDCYVFDYVDTRIPYCMNAGITRRRIINGRK